MTKHSTKCSKDSKEEKKSNIMRLSIFLCFPDYPRQLPTVHVVFYDVQSERLN